MQTNEQYLQDELGTVIATEESLVKLVQRNQGRLIWEKVFKFGFEGYICQLIKGDWLIPGTGKCKT